MECMEQASVRQLQTEKSELSSSLSLTKEKLTDAQTRVSHLRVRFVLYCIVLFLLYCTIQCTIQYNTIHCAIQEEIEQLKKEADEQREKDRVSFEKSHSVSQKQLAELRSERTKEKSSLEQQYNTMCEERDKLSDSLKRTEGIVALYCLRRLTILILYCIVLYWGYRETQAEDTACWRIGGATA